MPAKADRFAVTHFFYVYQDGMRVASGCAPSKAEAEREGGHYALMYGQDGPVALVVRKAPKRAIRSTIAGDEGKDEDVASD